MSVELILEVIGSELINTSDLENSSVGDQIFVSMDFITGKVSVSDKVLSWLVNIKGFWKLLSSEVHREGVSSIIGKVDFSNLNGIVSKEIVPDELKIF